MRPTYLPRSILSLSAADGLQKLGEWLGEDLLIDVVPASVGLTATIRNPVLRKYRGEGAERDEAVLALFHSIVQTDEMIVNRNGRRFRFFDEPVLHNILSASVRNDLVDCILEGQAARKLAL